MHGRVLIKPDEALEETSFGLVLPDNIKEKPVTGEVIEGGVDVKVGDRVLFSRYGFDEVKKGKELFYVVSEASILYIF